MILHGLHLYLSEDSSQERSGFALRSAISRRNGVILDQLDLLDFEIEHASPEVRGNLEINATSNEVS